MRIASAASVAFAASVAVLATTAPTAVARSAQAEAEATAVPASAREWDFRVWLNDREIGWHRYVLREDGAATEVESRAQFDVRFLFVNAYRYRHEARERWRGACLDGLQSTTVTNGAVEHVAAVSTGQALRIARPSGDANLPGCVMSFAYWDPRILDASRLLNSQTGEWLPVRIETLGTGHVTVGGRSVAATRHRLSAPDLQIDLWYVDRKWVGLEALMPGGRVLRYELRSLP
jgi:hypothetical protein